MLAGGAATSLLLDATTLPIHSNLDYVIHVNADFFTANNIPSDILTNNNVRRIFGQELEAEVGTIQYQLVVPASVDVEVDSNVEVTAIVQRRVMTVNGWGTPELVDVGVVTFGLTGDDLELDLDGTRVAVISADGATVGQVVS